MNYGKKTKAQLVEELQTMKVRIAELESGEGYSKPFEAAIEYKGKTFFPPEHDGEDLEELADIIDVHSIQSLMNNFYDLTHIPMSITDLKGKVLVGVGWQEICTKFHRVNPGTCKNCIESDIELSSGVPEGRSKLYKCKNNMWDIATPIMVGGKHVGNVFSGQFFFDDEPLDYELFRSQAAKYGFPEREYLSALEAVQRLSRGSLNAGMAFFVELAQMISQLSYSNVQLNRSLAERDALMNSLQATKHDIRGIFENSSLGIYRTTPSGRFLNANPALARIYGYDSPKELMNCVTHVGKQLYADPEAREQWISLIDKHNFAIFEAQMRKKDGSTVWVRQRAQTVRDAEGNTLYYEGFTEDITERKRAEEEMKKAEEKYRGIFENAIEGIFRTTPDGAFLDANPALARIFGYDSPEDLMSNVNNVGHQLHAKPETREQFIELMEKQDYAVFEAEIRKKDGSTCWAFFQGHAVRNTEAKTVYYEGFVIDITEQKHTQAELRQYRDHLEALVRERTIQLEEKNRLLMSEIAERKKAEEALSESENTYRTIFENNGNATLFYGEDARITLVNTEFLKMFQFARDEIEGKKRWVDLILKEDVERLTEYHRLRGIDPDAVPRNYELRLVDRYGNIRNVYMSIAMIPGTQKRVASILDITPLKEAEKALRKSEMHYRLLFENAGVAIANLDAEGRHLSFNDNLVEFTGYTRQELAVIKSADITHPDYREQIEDLKSRQIRGEIDSFTSEKCYIRKDGSLRWGELQSTPIRDEQGNFLSAVLAINDITERKQAEKALAESENLYRNLFENAAIGMFQTSLEGRFLRINKAYATMLGYESPEEVISIITDAATQVHADPGNRAELLAALGKQDWFYAEQPYLRKDGSIMIGKLAIRKVFKPDDSKEYLEGIVEDITEQKQAEKELKKYVEEITDLYENAPCGYHSLGPDGTFLRINKTELAWLGYTREEMIGKMKLPDLLTKEGKETFWQKFPLFKKRGWASNHEYSLIRKDSSILPVLINATAVFDENGNFLISRGSLFDNTERKRVEEALIENEALYRNLFENAAIGMFQSSLAGRFLRINKAFAMMLGYETPEEVIATITDTATQIHADSGNRAELLAALKKQDWFYAEQTYLRKDGSIMIGKISIRRVLKSNGDIAYLEGIVEDITERKKAEEALQERERELQIKAKNLEEVNTTLKVLLNALESDKAELEGKVLVNIKDQVFPYLEKLKKTSLTEEQLGYINAVKERLHDLFSPFIHDLTSRYLDLTHKELLVASLIKEGKTTKEIEAHLNMTSRTVCFHRENLRKKLGLNKTKVNLQTFLMFLSKKDN